MELYTEKTISPAGQVNSRDLGRWGHNMLVFLAPLGIVYLLQVSGSLQNGSVGLNDLVPTRMTLGALELYVVNSAVDLLRKFADSKK